ncbi:MAG: AmmeMemoRadiSam system protein A, partial [Lachnospiraceae bacterium]|nr:AmmeMemoRadiSam system protein A [Lachnospiraceae bacterium]
MSIVAGYIVPHPPIAVHEIGRGEEKKIAGTLDSFDRIAMDIARQEPETILLTSPHSVMYSDYFHISPGQGAVGDFSNFRAPKVSISVSYDEEFEEALDALCNRRA